MNNRKCACCNLYELPHGSVFEICPVCGWEDDDLQNEQPDFEGGANELSLNQARQLFKEKQLKEKTANAINEKIFCPLLNKKIYEGYCWELRNIGTDSILLEGDVVQDWDIALNICIKCGRYED